jgi:nicotinamidase-related amidase
LAGSPQPITATRNDERAALIIVDMQNDFVLIGAPLEVPDARATIAAHQALLRAFRGAGRPVGSRSALPAALRSDAGYPLRLSL